MKVLVVTPWFPSESAPGTGIFNLRDVELLARDHEVTVLHLFDPRLRPAPRGIVLDCGANVDPVPFNTGQPLTVMQTARKIKRLAPEHDLVHTMAFPALLPTKLSRVSSILPWVHTEHWSGMVGRPRTIRGHLGAAALRPLVKHPDHMVVVGAQLGDAVDRYRKVGQKSRVIPNFVRFDAGARLPSSPPTTVELVDATTPLRLIAVGGLAAHKGVLEAVRTIAHLVREGIDARLEWIGVGNLKQEAEKTVDRLGIADRVSFPGFLEPEQVTEHMLRSHVFILPTDGETFGVAIAEALAVGLPVVTSGHGGHLGFLPPQASRVVAKQPEALARAVRDLVADTHRWPAKQIVEYARSTFSEESRRERYLDVYESAKRSIQG